MASTALFGTAHFLLDDADRVGLGELEHTGEWPLDSRGGCQIEVVGITMSNGDSLRTIVIEPLDPFMLFAVAIIGGAILFGILPSFRDINRLIQPYIIFFIK